MRERRELLPSGHDMAIPITNTQQQWIPAQDRVSNFPPWVEEVPGGVTLSWGAMDCSWLLKVYVCVWGGHFLQWPQGD